VKLAFELGNDVNATTDFSHYPFGDIRLGGATALHGAAMREANSIAQFLIDKGAKLNPTTVVGWTPLTIAEGVWIQGGYKEEPLTAKFLRELMVKQGLSLDREPPAQGPERRNMAGAYANKSGQ